MVISMKDNLKIVKNKELEFCIMQMEINTKDSLKMVNSKEKVNIVLMGQIIMGSSQMD